MGIRFHCHECQHRLNVKEFLAGKRGKCPRCKVSFRIPMGDQELSIPIDLDSPESNDSPASDDSSADEAAAEKTSPASDPAPAKPATASSVDRAPVAAAPEASPAKVSRGDQSAKKAAPSPEPAEIAAVSEPAVSKSNVPTDPPPQSMATPDQSQHETSQDESSPMAVAGDVVWYVRPPSGGQYGPAGGSLLQLWIKEHRVVPGSLVWRDGWAQWRAAEEVFGPKFATLGVADIDLNADLPESPLAVNEPIRSTDSSAAVDLQPQPSPTEFERRQMAKRKRRTRMIAMLAGVSLFLIVVIILVVVSKSVDV